MLHEVIPSYLKEGSDRFEMCFLNSGARLLSLGTVDILSCLFCGCYPVRRVMLSTVSDF